MAQILFDVTLITSIRVEASDVHAAREMLRDAIDGSNANLGAFPNGDPIICQVSIEGDIDLVDDGEING